MEVKDLITKTISLEAYGIHKAKVNYQLTPGELQQISLANSHGEETRNGVLCIKTGNFTGRSPKDRYVVKDEVTRNSLWWGAINIPFDPQKFDLLYDQVAKYLSNREVFVRDAFACAHPKYRTPIRVVNEFPWSNLFAYNMFLRPLAKELENFKEDWLILNAPGFQADPEHAGTRQGNFAILNFTKKVILIGGTGYTGEIKKAVFSALNFELPVHHNVLTMHCAANVGKHRDTAIFFGLSGTGKTTLSADPKRKLIGDDEHGWTPEHEVFNFEGGCYAKVAHLSPEREPDIYHAIRPGAMLENVKLDKHGNVDFEDLSISQNTRVSYPIDFIDNIQTPSVGKNPRNIFFLTADAFGVLPPISKLSPGQAAYHFISGYTAKIAGTEEGINEPEPNFSACFGAPFMPLHPTRYARMLSTMMKEGQVDVWLVNTGWTGGPYGSGARISLSYTRAMIDAALGGHLEQIAYTIDPVFGLKVPASCPGVPKDLLTPRNTWKDKGAYDRKARNLAGAFWDNFLQYEAEASAEIISGGPLYKNPG